MKATMNAVKRWAGGHPEAVNRIDPKVAAVVFGLTEIVLTLDLHTRVGIDAESALTIAAAIGFIVTTLRSWQVEKKRGDAVSGS